MLTHGLAGSHSRTTRHLGWLTKYGALFTQVRVEGIVTNHLVPRLGTYSMAGITPSTVQALVKTLSLTLSSGTVQGIYGTLDSIYRAAVRDRIVVASPCVGIKLPQVSGRPVKPLTVEAISAVANAIGPVYRPLVILGVGAGLRVGESLGLPVANIDFLRRQLLVTQQAVTIRKTTTIAPPKTPASTRTVPLASAVVEELASYLRERPDRASGLLVADANGHPIPQNRFSQTWIRAVARAGLPKGTRYHDLRHTYASALISSGCSVKAVQMSLGHESAVTTLNTYAHLWPDDDERARNAVDAFLQTDVSASCQIAGADR